MQSRKQLICVNSYRNDILSPLSIREEKKGRKRERKTKEMCHQKKIKDIFIKLVFIRLIIMFLLIKKLYSGGKSTSIKNNIGNIS